MYAGEHDGYSTTSNTIPQVPYTLKFDYYSSCYYHCLYECMTCIWTQILQCVYMSWCKCQGQRITLWIQ